MADYKDVAVFCEITAGKLARISTEGLGIGKTLADQLGQELVAIVVGSDVGSVAKEAIAYGASKVYAVDDALLKNYQSDAYTAVLEKVVKQVLPKIVIMGQNDVGRDLGPRLAFRLGTTITMDCIDLAIDASSKRLLQTKPVYGGNAQAIFSGAIDPQIVTIRTKAMAPLAEDASRQGEIVNIEAGLDASAIRTKFVEKVVEEVEGVKLEDAEVVVSGGRGIGSAEGFTQLAELAKALKGAVGASRAACDAGWAPETIQIGLTGKIIAPDLYIAVGISGASQHMSGCSGSKNVIAINKDPEANIFRQARFGAVGDWKKVFPAFTAKVKELVSS
jgi:electron transfer flavoprotein alpha subunit